ncbi:MAG: ABC transporter ATP-binding protein [Candidatus Eisenbacteria bacterium]|uniref:ABC transporter ATP-binding protein n=1 Tax=Eiseniibacteriota bacterium TaxID=2212470 RepID=A0A7Y2E804_UNCEI|nr:ABC transporter ATP-binding protein [Candidatus Eisenbacteria bacterium]
MIEVRDLVKKYGSVVAVDGVSFDAAAGSIFGLLGPNGAGKSTTIGCISGLLRPHAGTVRVLGHDIVGASTKAKKELGVVPQEIALYEDLSARENIAYWGGAYGLSGPDLKRRTDEVLALVGLADRAKEPIKKYSGGMKRRLNFACGIVHEPKVLLLDEPTVGVDPQSRVNILDLVRSQAQTGTCVLYTTHYMEEAEALCDSLAIVDGGKVIAQGTMRELRQRTEERDLLRLNGQFDVPHIEKKLHDLDHIEIIQIHETQITIAAGQGGNRLPEILGAIGETGADIRETTLSQPNLESLFIKLTGKELRE